MAEVTAITAGKEGEDGAPKVEISGEKRIFHELISSAAIYLHPALKGKAPRSWLFYPEDNRFGVEEAYVVDIDKAIQVLEDNESQQEILPDKYGNREQELFELSKSAFKRSVKAFVKNGDVSSALAVEVGRLMRPGNVVVTQEDFGRFLYLGDEFPKRDEERGALEVGVKYVFRQIEGYKEILSQNGVELTEEQIIDLILRGLVSHEYGHAVDRTMQLLTWGEYVSGIPGGGEPNLSDRYRIRGKMHQEIFDRIAPNEDLATVLALEPDDKEDAYYTNRESTSSERVGRGFHYLGMRYALLELGLDKEKADNIVRSFTRTEDSKLNQYKNLADEIRATGLNLEIFCHGINDLVSQLRKLGRNDLAGKFPYLDMPDGRQLGYFYPLSQEQIRTYIAAF